MSSPFDDILSYDDLEIDSTFGDDVPQVSDKRASAKRKHSDDASTSSDSRPQPKKKPDRASNLWKLTRSRFGHTVYRCASCTSKPPKVIRRDGRTYVMQELCDGCVDGNIYLNDVYYRFFGRKNQSK
ncbi:hypothetical protein AAVH_23492 [Aphelenchoides avenae]|nr:hypothetical protein AAVH_23492 [Aphelenchus avenae]